MQFLSFLLLIGPTSFATECHTKEIGIRKVPGTNVAPFAHLAMQEIRQNFIYRAEVSRWVFALAGGLALVIALLTVSTQAVRAAIANPVESLRYE